MKVVILAGGLGTRLSEETHLRPKPMVEIGGRPILWHIMKIFSSYGINDFIICCGYRGYFIKEYFSNYLLHCSDVKFDFVDNSTTYINNRVEPWRITLVDTGINSMTGGRLGRVKNYLEGEKDFFFTYGDGVGDINITELLSFHRSHGKEATVTACSPPGRFGALDISNGTVKRFIEKPKGDEGKINAGFFVLSQKVFSRISGDKCIWEQEPLRGLAADGELKAFEHDGFWQPMDTVRDRDFLEEIWEKGTAPWKSWSDK